MVAGTVAILEKEAGILKSEHRPVVEAFRDHLMQEFKAYLGDSDESGSSCSKSTCQS